MARWNAALAVLVLLLAGVLVVALAAGPAGLPGRTTPSERRVAALAGAERAASGFAVAFLGVDHRHLDRAIDDVRRRSTGAFLREYDGQRAELERAVRRARASSRGTVLAVGVVRLGRDSADLVLAADGWVSNRTTPQPVARHYRMRVGLVRNEGDWLVRSMRFVS